MRVDCTIDNIDLDGDFSNSVAGIQATCSRCGHETESFGDGDASIMRCLALMREECPNRESNFYVEE